MFHQACRFTIASFLALLSACAPRDPFLAELAAAPRVKGTSKTDIAYVAEKFLPTGMKLQDAKEFLEQRGFKMSFQYKGKEVPPGQQWFVFSKRDRYYLIFAEDTEVIVESDGAKILKARGWLFLKGI